MKRTVTIHHLELTSPGELRPAPPARVPMRVLRAAIPSPELSRFLYTAVGGGWFWIDRLDWTFDRWHNWLARPEVETWVGYVDGTPAGYFELEAQPAGDVEIVYFGLLPSFAGQGLGGELLTAATRRAFEVGARRVWVHTCSLDHPAALSNYQSRGFREFKEESAEVSLPENSPGPWPGARS